MLSPLLIFAKTPQQGGVPYPMLFFIMTAVILVGGLVVATFVFRRMFARPDSNKDPNKESAPPADTVPAFMTSSIPSVIPRLREQAEALEPLHQPSRER